MADKETLRRAILFFLTQPREERMPETGGVMTFKRYEKDSPKESKLLKAAAKRNKETRIKVLKEVISDLEEQLYHWDDHGLSAEPDLQDDIAETNEELDRLNDELEQLEKKKD